MQVVIITSSNRGKVHEKCDYKIYYNEITMMQLYVVVSILLHTE